MTDNSHSSPESRGLPFPSRSESMESSPEHPWLAPVTCPKCGKQNSAGAVFCSNQQCHKALGDFQYVLEELPPPRWHEAVAEKFSEFIGRPHFLAVHFLWFSLWVAANTGLLIMAPQFDAYPFSFLGILLTVEGLLITAFVLISQNRQGEHANRRAQLDYEITVRTYRELMEANTRTHHEITELREEIRRLRERLEG